MHDLNISDIQIVKLYYGFAAQFLVLFIMKTIIFAIQKLNTYMRYGQILIISSDIPVNMEPRNLSCHQDYIPCHHIHGFSLSVRDHLRSLHKSLLSPGRIPGKLLRC